MKYKNGWLSEMIELLDICENEISVLEQKHEDYLALNKKLEREYMESNNTRELIREFDEEMRSIAKPIRNKYILKRLQYLRERLKENVKNFNHSPSPEWLKDVVWNLNNSEEMIFEMEQLKKELSPRKKRQLSPTEIQQALDIPTKKVFELCGIKVRNFMVKCPFHDDKTPSMSVKGNFCYCFACGASYNNIDFVKEFKNLSFVEAVEFIK